MTSSTKGSRSFAVAAAGGDRQMTHVVVSRGALIGLLAGILALLAIALGATAPPAEAAMKKCYGYGKNDFSGLKVKGISCNKAEKTFRQEGGDYPNNCPSSGRYGKCKYKKSGFKCKLKGEPDSSGMWTVYKHSCKKKTKRGKQKAKFYGVFTG